MIQDKLLLFSDAQALTVDAISDVRDNLVSGLNWGAGWPLHLFIHVDVLLAGTSPTITPTFETSAAAALTSATVIVNFGLFSTLAAGAILTATLPQGSTWLKFCGFRYDMGGTSPTVTVTSGVVLDLDVLTQYASGLSI